MKLSELFPEGAKVMLGGKEYSLKYSTRAKLELEKTYGDESPVRQALQQVTGDGMKVTELVNILHACLVGAKNPIDKEILIDLMESQDYTDYASAVLWAFMTAQLTPEQMEKLEVLAAQSKKKKIDPETTLENTHISGVNAG